MSNPNPTINNFASLKKYGPMLDVDLKAVFAKYGLAWKGRNASVSEARMEVDYKVKVSMGSVEDQTEAERRAYNVYAPLLGLPNDGFGKIVIVGGDSFRITGVQPNKPKNSVKIVRIRDGRPFQTSPKNLRFA